MRRALGVALAISTLALVTSAAGGTTSVRACIPWTVVRAPSVGDWSNTLFGVAARSPNDAWAVGSYIKGTDTRTYGLHWDGRAWSITGTQNGPNDNHLSDVATVGAVEAWAVGHFVRDDRYTAGLVQRWDGRAWTIVAVPDTGYETRLYGVDGVSVNDVWAVGIAQGRALVLHWNGAAWSVVPIPRLTSGESVLYGVDARARNDVWAVGRRIDTGRPLVAHWNGRAWRITTLRTGRGGTLYDVVALSATKVWAVGHYGRPSSGVQYTALTLRWNGTAWALFRSPARRWTDTMLFGVAAHRSGVWAVGMTELDGDPADAIAQRWDGRRWRAASTRRIGTAATLNAVAFAGRRNGWAVGGTAGGGVLTLRFVGCR